MKKLLTLVYVAIITALPINASDYLKCKTSKGGGRSNTHRHTQHQASQELQEKKYQKQTAEARQAQQPATSHQKISTPHNTPKLIPGSTAWNAAKNREQQLKKLGL